jgi:prepilin signal peptidase PulO-like enzyme (type II secretory pathway)
MHTIFFIIALFPPLIFAAFIDWRTYHLPPFIWAVVATIGLLRIICIKGSALDILFALGIAFSVYAIGAYVLDGKMGAGDIKLLAAISISLRFWEWALMLFLACAIAMPVAARARSKSIHGGKIPFIPFITLGYMIIAGMAISGLSDYLATAIGS